MFEDKLVDEELLQDTLMWLNLSLRGKLISIRERSMAEYNNLLYALAQGRVCLGGDDACLDIDLKDSTFMSCNPYFDSPQCRAYREAHGVLVDDSRLYGGMPEAVEDGTRVSIDEVLARVEKKKVQ